MWEGGGSYMIIEEEENIFILIKNEILIWAL